MQNLKEKLRMELSQLEGLYCQMRYAKIKQENNGCNDKYRSGYRLSRI